MPNDVAALAVRNLINLARLDELDPAWLFEGTGQDPSEYLATRRWMDWRVYCHVFERYAEWLGGWERCERLGDRQPEASPTWTRALAGFLTPNAMLPLLVASVPRMWRTVNASISQESERVWLIRAEIGAEFQPLLPLMAASTGGWRACTTRLDLRPCEVGVLEISGRVGVWRVTPPRPRPRLEQLGRAYSATWISLFGRDPGGAMEMLEELDRQNVAADLQRGVAMRALSAMTNACFILDERGSIVWSSPDGRRLVEQDASLVFRLARGVPGHGIVLRPLPGISSHRVAVIHDEDEERERRLAHCRASWRLAEAETRALSELVLGRTNKEIAAAMGIAEPTVEVHVTTLFRRSGTANRTALVAWFWTFAPDAGA